MIFFFTCTKPALPYLIPSGIIPQVFTCVCMIVNFISFTFSVLVYILNYVIITSWLILIFLFPSSLYGEFFYLFFTM